MFDFYTFDRKRELLSELIESGKEKVLGAEIGVWRGDTTCYLLDQHLNLSMIGIDSYPIVNGRTQAELARSLMHKLAFRSEDEANRIYAETKTRFDRYGERAKLIRQASLGAVDSFADELFDFVCIDGDHHYEAVKADILAWLPKVKKGGWLIGDDFAWDLRYDQVARAVIEIFGYRFAVMADLWFVKKV